MQLGKVSSKILLKSLYSQSTTPRVKLRYYCAYMSVFKGRKFEISVICAYFNTFQLKAVVKFDNIHDCTEISSFSLFKVEICSSKFQIGDSSHISPITHN